jgi:hypothetical protein
VGGFGLPDVFLSYSRRDMEFVRRLADDLEGRGKDVWVDVDGIRDAEKFPEALRRAIERSDAFVFVRSRTRSAGVPNEVQIIEFPSEQALTDFRR